MRMINDIELSDFRNHKKKRKENVSFKAPKEFVDIVDVNKTLKGYPTRGAYLQELAKELKPTADALKKRKLIKNEEENPFFE